MRLTRIEYFSAFHELGFRGIHVTKLINNEDLRIAV